MRIIHVTDCYLPRLGGIELQVHDLACRQVALGHRVTVLTVTAPAAGGAGRSPLEVVRWHRRGAGPERVDYRKAFLAAPHLAEDLAAFDAVHTHVSVFSPLAMLATRAAARRGVPTVATVHSMFARSEHHLANLRRVTAWADLPAVWTAVSAVAAEPIQRVVGDRAPVSVLPNGVDPGRWQVAHQPGDGTTLRVAVVSRLARRKRVSALMEILRQAHSRLPAGKALAVTVLGDGPERGSIERYLRRHGMGWVRLLGRRDRDSIRSVFARSDLFVAPATLESFGIAALEARCAGLPVLARSGTGVQDFIEEGREGWLAGSDRALADILVRLAGQPHELARVAAHNRASAPRISWESVLAACEEAYSQAAEMHEREWPARRAGRDDFAPAGPSGVAAAG
jgi:glycosyltransferase involved in cell wall biosynthesis